MSTHDDTEAEAFFQKGDDGTYHGGPGDSIPVGLLHWDHEDEPVHSGPSPEQLERRARHTRWVTALVGTLGAVCALGFSVRAAMSRGTEDAPAERAASVVPALAAQPVPVLPATVKAIEPVEPVAAKAPPPAELPSPPVVAAVAAPKAAAPAGPRDADVVAAVRTARVPERRPSQSVVRASSAPTPVHAAPAWTPSPVAAVRSQASPRSGPPTVSFPD